MAAVDRVEKWLAELTETIEQLMRHRGADFVFRNRNEIDDLLVNSRDEPTATMHDKYIFDRWYVSTLDFLRRVNGAESHVHRQFERYALLDWAMDWNSSEFDDQLRDLYSIFMAAKEQIEGGYLFEIRNLVHAEVFSDELDLALHYLANEGKIAAAVVAGVVLETTMRQLCTGRGLPTGQLNKMNEALHANNAYTKIV